MNENLGRRNFLKTSKLLLLFFDWTTESLQRFPFRLIFYRREKLPLTKLLQTSPSRFPFFSRRNLSGQSSLKREFRQRQKVTNQLFVKSFWSEKFSSATFRKLYPLLLSPPQKKQFRQNKFTNFHSNFSSARWGTEFSSRKNLIRFDTHRVSFGFVYSLEINSPPTFTLRKNSSAGNWKFENISSSKLSSRRTQKFVKFCQVFLRLKFRHKRFLHAFKYFLWANFWNFSPNKFYHDQSRTVWKFGGELKFRRNQSRTVWEVSNIPSWSNIYSGQRFGILPGLKFCHDKVWKFESLWIFLRVKFWKFWKFTGGSFRHELKF